MGAEFAASVAGRLRPFAEELPADVYQAVLAGVALGFGVHRRSLASFHKTTRDLVEVQHLMSDFGQELRKLDEALEILAAYVTRLRSQTGDSVPAKRTLH